MKQHGKYKRHMDNLKMSRTTRLSSPPRPPARKSTALECVGSVERVKLKLRVEEERWEEAKQGREEVEMEVEVLDRRREERTRENGRGKEGDELERASRDYLISVLLLIDVEIFRGL